MQERAELNPSPILNNELEFISQNGVIDRENLRLTTSKRLAEIQTRIENQAKDTNFGAHLGELLQSFGNSEKGLTLRQDLNKIGRVSALAGKYNLHDYQHPGAFDRRINDRIGREKISLVDAVAKTHDQAVARTEVLSEVAALIEQLTLTTYLEDGAQIRKELSEKIHEIASLNINRLIRNRAKEIKKARLAKESAIKAEKMRAQIHLVDSTVTPAVLKQITPKPIDQSEPVGNLSDRSAFNQRIEQYSQEARERIHQKIDEIYEKYASQHRVPEGKAPEQPESPEEPKSDDNAGNVPPIDQGPSGPEEDLNQLTKEMDDARNDYIEAKVVSRSFWKNLKGNIEAKFKNTFSKLGSLFGKFSKKSAQPEQPKENVLTPDQKMEQARIKYEEARNKYITKLSIEKTPEDLASEIYQQTLAEYAAEHLMLEHEVFSGIELEANGAKRGYKPYSSFYRNPWVRGAVGLGLNIGIGASAAVGLLPVTAGLLGARWAMGTVGVEGMLHGTQDLYSSKLGARSGGKQEHFANKKKFDKGQLSEEEYNQKGVNLIQNSLGSLDEDRIRKNQNMKEDSTEANLLEGYQVLLQERLKQEISLNKPQSYAESLREALGIVDNLNCKKDQAVIFERRAQATRWVAAGLISGAVTALTSANKITGFGSTTGAVGPDLHVTPSPSVTPEVGGIATADFSYQGADLYYENLLGHNEISSLTGTAHNMLAESWGINLDAVDPVNNTHASSHSAYWERFYQNRIENEKVVKTMTEFLKKQSVDKFGRGIFAFQNNDDLVYHFTNETGKHTAAGNVGDLIRYVRPANVSEFIDGIKRGVIDIVSPSKFKTA